MSHCTYLNYSVCNAYKLMMQSLYCRLQCTVVLVGVVFKDSLGCDRVDY